MVYMINPLTTRVILDKGIVAVPVVGVLALILALRYFLCKNVNIIFYILL